MKRLSKNRGGPLVSQPLLLLGGSTPVVSQEKQTKKFKKCHEMSKCHHLVKAPSLRGQKGGASNISQRDVTNYLSHSKEGRGLCCAKLSRPQVDSQTKISTVDSGHRTQAPQHEIKQF